MSRSPLKTIKRYTSRLQKMALGLDSRSCSGFVKSLGVHRCQRPTGSPTLGWSDPREAWQYGMPKYKLLALRGRWNPRGFGADLDEW